MKNPLNFFIYLTLFWAGAFYLVPFIFKMDAISQVHAIFQPFLTVTGLGSDDVGRDLLARVLIGGRMALQMGIYSVFGALIIGIPVGIFSAFKRSWIDEFIQRFTDLGLGFPSVLLGIIIVTIVGPGFWGLCLIIILINIPQVIRFVRNLSVSELSKEYIQGATAIGASPVWIAFYYLLPALKDSLVIISTTMLGTAVLEAAGLSFLGLGIMPPAPEWGAMVAEYRRYILAAPSLFLIPSMAIVIFSGSYILLAERLRKAA